MKKRRWYEHFIARDGFLIAWFATAVFVGVTKNPDSLGGFGAGINAGIVLQYVLFRKERAMYRSHLLQDEIDVNTLSQLTAKLDFKMLHQIDKAPFN